MLGAALLGEPIGPTRWLIAFLGFCGVLVIVHPTADGIDLYAGFILLAVLCMATRDLLTRTFSSAVSSTLITLTGAVGLASFSAAASWLQDEEWQPMHWREWGCLVGATLTGSAGFFSSVLLMRLGSVAFVSRLPYLRSPSPHPPQDITTHNRMCALNCPLTHVTWSWVAKPYGSLRSRVADPAIPLHSPPLGQRYWLAYLR